MKKEESVSGGVFSSRHKLKASVLLSSMLVTSMLVTGGVCIREVQPLGILQRAFAFSFMILFNLELVKPDHYLLLCRLCFSFSSVYS